MSFWEAIRKALYLARRSRFDHELEQELRFHFEPASGNSRSA